MPRYRQIRAAQYRTSECTRYQITLCDTAAECQDHNHQFVFIYLQRYYAKPHNHSSAHIFNNIQRHFFLIYHYTSGSLAITRNSHISAIMGTISRLYGLAAGHGGLAFGHNGTSMNFVNG